MKRAGFRLIPDDIILTKIYVLSGQKVMLDRDLAKLYEVETKQLKRQVNRNITRFPGDFMFELTTEEASRCQIGTLKRGNNTKYLPYAFTEQGVAMLSSILIAKEPLRSTYKLSVYLRPSGNCFSTIPSCV